MPPLLLLLALAPGATDFRQTHRPVDIADGVRTFVAAESPGGVVQGNVTVISGADASLVIDSGQYPTLARDIVDSVRTAKLPPVRFLVNTHWHGDHLLANHVFEAAWPGLVVIQHAETARVGEKTYADWTTVGIQRTRDYVAAIEKAFASGRTSQGKPVTDEMRDRYGTDLVLANAWLEQAADTRWSAPDLTFDDGISLDLGGRTVALRHLGKANTTGDVVAWDARTKTLVAGDIVVHPTPYSFGSYHSEWIEVLDAMRALEPAHLVPGHGEPMRDTRYLERLAALLAETRTQVRAAIAKGETLDEMRAHVTLDAYAKELAGDSVERRRAFELFYLEPAIEQAYKEAKGEPRSD